MPVLLPAVRFHEPMRAQDPEEGAEGEDRDDGDDPRWEPSLPSALVVLSTLSLSDAPVGESAAAATTGKARRARRLEEDVMIRARDADDDRPRALARAAPATGGARRAPMAIDEVDMPT